MYTSLAVLGNSKPEKGFFFIYKNEIPWNVFILPSLQPYSLLPLQRLVKLRTALTDWRYLEESDDSDPINADWLGYFFTLAAAQLHASSKQKRKKKN